MSAVESHIYEFSILAHQSEATIAAILEQVPFDQWGIALKGADPAVQDTLMRSMPQRQVQAFEEMVRRASLEMGKTESTNSARRPAR